MRAMCVSEIILVGRRQKGEMMKASGLREEIFLI
jgi:hypothetical protein